MLPFVVMTALWATVGVTTYLSLLKSNDAELNISEFIGITVLGPFLLAFCLAQKPLMKDAKMQDVDHLYEEIGELLEIIGTPADGALITEHTQLLDFTLGLPQKEEDKLLNKISDYVGFEVSFSDRLIEVADKLYKVRNNA